MSEVLRAKKQESYKIFDEIAGTYDFLNRLLSVGIDVYWRSKLLAAIPKKKENLIAVDLATGTGDMALGLTKLPQIKQIIAMDMSKEMIEYAKVKVHKKSLENKISFKLGDACQIELPDNSVDIVTITYGIRNFSDPLQSLKEIKRILVPGGKLLIEEFGLPKNKFIKSFYLFYFRKLLPFVGNLLSKHKDAYTYLNETVEDFPFAEEFLDLMRESGLKNEKASPMTFGISYLYTAIKE